MLLELIGSCYSNLKNYSAAQVFHEQAYKILVNNYGDDSIEVNKPDFSLKIIYFYNFTLKIYI